jgi:two-component system, chemotaxis family, protein-glutamate methylesterase/glutaminase
MEPRNIIVIGASAGGFDAIKKLVAQLPANLNAAIFIVWHMSPDVYGVLPDVLNRLGTVPAANAVDMESIEPNRIYVAPPDRHLIMEKDRVRVTRGPKENRFRPAVDPLFRSAAYVYKSNVIGIVLSGSLDDGTAGLWSIKQHGGIAIVQDPADAEIPSMPESALRAVRVDHMVPVAEMGSLLIKLTSSQPPDTKQDFNMEDNDRMRLEVQIAKQEDVSGKEVMKYGEFSPYTCPECHGVLTALQDGERVRFRCHTGHAFSADALLTTLTENIDENLWNAIRSVDESVILLNNMGDNLAENNEPKLAALYFKKAKEAEGRSKRLREALLEHEQLSTEQMRKEVEKGSD